METRQSSRKRKHSPPSHPFTGTFTRSKSQLYIHRNRSGRARSDSFRKSQHVHLSLDFIPRQRSKLGPLVSQEELLDSDEIMSRISIKDLRARRVFSRSSIIDECCAEKNSAVGKYSDAVHPSENGDFVKLGGGVAQFNIGSSDVSSIREVSCGNKDARIGSYSDGKTHQCVAEFSIDAQNLSAASTDILFSTEDDNFINEDVNVGSCSDVEKSSETGEMEKSGIEFQFEAQFLDKTNPNLSDSAINLSPSNAEQMGDGEGDIPNAVDGSNEGCVHSTPPDDIFDKPGVDEDGRNRAECAWPNSDHALVKQSNGRIERNNICIHSGSRTKLERRSNCISKSKPVLSPCSRLKVFKTPSSFSYRRLLPYLMNITYDDSCASKNDECPKHEKDLEEKPFSLSLDSQCQGIPDVKCEANGIPREHHTNDSDSLSAITLIHANGSCNDNEPNLTRSSRSFDLQRNCALKADQISGQPKKMEPADDIASTIHRTDMSVIPLNSCVRPGASCGEDNVEIKVSNNSAAEVDENCLMSSVRFTTGARPRAAYLGQNPSQVETLALSGVSVPGFSKGILKTNPRGCRGLCTCLNCASFRLHAERAFEFSRNQMQDAEEVSLDLIQELSYLRNMLEQSASSRKHFAVLQINEGTSWCYSSAAEQMVEEKLCQWEP
ncbi:uncharacterized protein LOC131150253 isoform X2 [Malania oleifera]|uniref:uncharacterized protein LOC131150253 isoform X2 n=1 Tax=Malania oleifera TaxID=397392 RepID=UPI0025AE1DBA|nr:uncharacterized protein LOC131150253 isoform X2 [Malania oleifera]